MAPGPRRAGDRPGIAGRGERRSVALEDLCDTLPGDTRDPRRCASRRHARALATPRPFASPEARDDVWRPRSDHRSRGRLRNERRKPALQGFRISGRRDSNSGPLVPQTSALTRLRHAPCPGHATGRPESPPLAPTSAGECTKRAPNPSTVRTARGSARTCRHTSRSRRSTRCRRT
jgi:hypothetical protein